MGLAPIDWAIVVVYVAFALFVGVAFAKRAGKSVDQYFLSGRSLSWWVAGTSMVATTFAADTPLLVCGWVRSGGIWQNWAWWCIAVSTVLQIFLFARWWRRGEVMTKAELTELRYGGTGAKVLRGFLGVMHAAALNTLVIGWVLLAAQKISGVLFGVDEITGLALACLVALTYSLLAGFWGVVVTDLVQFTMAMAGAIVLAALAWQAVGAGEAVVAAAERGVFSADVLRFFPAPGEGTPLDGSFWEPAVTACLVYVGVQWWAAENVDGSGTTVQRICAARDERQGMLATLWYAIAHFSLRPWCWILVGIASLVVLPPLEVPAPAHGTVVDVGAEAIVLAHDDGRTTRVDLAGAVVFDAEHYPDFDAHEARDQGWRALPAVARDDVVRAGDVVARSDPERAYVVMMRRFLPVGLLGLVAASLLAAFMSTIDTHVNLASSFFVNDVYRRFLRRRASEGHYVVVARASSVGVLLAGAVAAWLSRSIGELFQFFLAFMGGAGPVYVLRWFWWRVRPSTELTAMLVSATVSTFVTLRQDAWDWPLGALAPDGVLSAAGRIVLVAAASFVAALVALAVARRPDPAQLVPFYRKVRPLGAWGPVRALCPEATPRAELGVALLGAAGALAATFGSMLGAGFYFLDRGRAAAVAAAIAVAGAAAVAFALRRLEPPARGRVEKLSTDA